jgi:hypothetical protein
MQTRTASMTIGKTPTDSPNDRSKMVMNPIKILLQVLSFPTVVLTTDEMFLSNVSGGGVVVEGIKVEIDLVDAGSLGWTAGEVSRTTVAKKDIAVVEGLDDFFQAVVLMSFTTDGTKEFLQGFVGFRVVEITDDFPGTTCKQWQK